MFVLFGTQVTAQDFNKGLDAFNDFDYETAFKELEPLAKQGMPEAQYFLGEMYSYGKGVPKDNFSAQKWFRLSAKQDHYMSSVRLGNMYRAGQVPSQNYAEAISWYRRGAVIGNYYAQNNLGLMYKYGLGVLQDNIIAYMWYSIAISNGAYQPYALGQLAAGMSQADVLKAKAMAYECMSSSYEDCGDAHDFYVGTRAYNSGNFAIAFQKFLPLAIKGISSAQSRLGEMYFFGEGVPQSYTEANRLYQLAANQGDATALYGIGYMYEEGEGVHQDIVMAHMLYNVASALGLEFDGENYAAQDRDRLSKQMSPEDISKAQGMARECMASDYKKCGY